jgi:hypothetical protein
VAFHNEYLSLNCTPSTSDAADAVDEPPTAPTSRPTFPFVISLGILIGFAYIPVANGSPVLVKRDDSHISSVRAVEAAMIPLLVLASGVLAGKLVLSRHFSPLIHFEFRRPHAGVHVSRRMWSLEIWSQIRVRRSR